jgi:hypothetical protein
LLENKEKIIHDCYVWFTRSHSICVSFIVSMYLLFVLWNISDETLL